MRVGGRRGKAHGQFVGVPKVAGKAQWVLGRVQKDAKETQQRAAREAQWRCVRECKGGTMRVHKGLSEVQWGCEQGTEAQGGCTRIYKWPARLKQHPQTALEKLCSNGWKSTGRQQLKPRGAGRGYGGERDLPQGLAISLLASPLTFWGSQQEKSQQ